MLDAWVTITCQNPLGKAIADNLISGKLVAMRRQRVTASGCNKTFHITFLTKLI